jgi:uncharacterized protein (DUF1015 family)
VRRASVILEPFEPLIYSGAIEDFISPPLDAAKAGEISRLLKKKHNVLHLIFGEERTNRLLDEWERDGILISSGKNALIILEQRFKYLGTEGSRIGVIGILNLDVDRHDLIPHERTIERFVDERKRIFKEIEAQIEPIFVTVVGSRLETVLRDTVSKESASFSFNDSSNVLNIVYIIRETHRINDILDALRKVKGIIADGHHRFKALNEINEERVSAGLEKFPCYIYVTSFNSDSLKISGFHRIIKDHTNGNFLEAIDNYFTSIEVLEPKLKERIAIYDGKFRELNPLPLVEKLIDRENSGRYVFTDFSDSIILSRIYSLDINRDQDMINFTASYEEAIEQIDSGKASLAILIPPWNKSSFMNLVEAGKLFSPKSTFFFPKIYAGIAIMRMSSDRRNEY